MPDPVPHSVRALADERARARRARDWATADRLKAEIEAAGWRIIDAGTLYSLEALPPAVVDVDGEIRYGTSDAVPSVLESPPATAATAVLVAGEREGLIGPAVAALQAGSPDVQVVVVADDPTPAVAGEIALLANVEVVRLARRLGAAAARNAGVRRATGRIVVLLDPRVVVAGDLAGDLAAALADPGVGVAGLAGLDTDDFVHFASTPASAASPAAVDLLALAFRREDYTSRGPLDEHFVHEAYLGAWWSLVLRDVPEDAVFGVDAPRRAALASTAFRLAGDAPAPPDERTEKRQRYRLLKWFAARRDLLEGTGA